MDKQKVLRALDGKTKDDKRSQQIFSNDALKTVDKIKKNLQDLENELRRGNFTPKSIDKMKSISKNIEYMAGKLTTQELDLLERTVSSEIELKQRGLW